MLDKQFRNFDIFIKYILKKAYEVVFMIILKVGQHFNYENIKKWRQKNKILILSSHAVI